jgi:glutamate racemase
LLQKHIEEVVGEHVTVLSSAEETANDVLQLLTFYQLVKKQLVQPSHIFYTTGSIPMFKVIVSKWLDIENPNIKMISFN